MFAQFQQSAGREASWSNHQLMISQTDPEGRIRYVNRDFLNLSGYQEVDLLGRSHRVVRHPDMPSAIFRLMWQTLPKGNEFVAFVKNLDKSGSYHWAFTTIIQQLDERGQRAGYLCVRRTANPHAIPLVEELYGQMRQAELMQPGEMGITRALALLQDFLDQRRHSYAQCIFRLQEG